MQTRIRIHILKGSKIPPKFHGSGTYRNFKKEKKMKDEETLEETYGDQILRANYTGHENSYKKRMEKKTTRIGPAEYR